MSSGLLYAPSSSIIKLSAFSRLCMTWRDLGAAMFLFLNSVGDHFIFGIELFQGSSKSSSTAANISHRVTL